MKEKVKKLLDKALEDNKSLYLIEFKISEGNQIKVIIDGDQGVTVNDCIAVSRAIEHNIDREETDFSLDVASAGVSEPLSMPRQYKKNVGRILKLKTQKALYLLTSSCDPILMSTISPSPIINSKVMR